MGKVLFWFIVIVAILFGARLLARAASGEEPSDKAKKPAKPGKQPSGQPDMLGAEAMVRCEHCGIHMPRSEAFLSNGKTWCGPEHARLGPPRS